MSEKVCDSIIREFGLDPQVAHIVNGHMPVKLKKGDYVIVKAGEQIPG